MEIDPLEAAIVYEGQGTAASLRKAIAHYVAACRGGDPRGCYHFDEASVTTGMRGADPGAGTLAESRCGGGDMAACYALALTFDDSGGMPKDPKRAFALYKRACEGDYPFACDGVAEYYFVSFPSQEPDAMAKAVSYAWRACEAGLGASCHMATVGGDFDGWPADVPSRLELTRMACDKGHVFSCTRLAEEATPEPAFACDQCEPETLGHTACGDCEAVRLFDRYCCDTCSERDTHAACADPEFLKRHPLKTVPVSASVRAVADQRLRALLEPVVGWLTPSCDAGHPIACHDLASIVGNAAWPLHDAQRARSLLERACDAAYGSACARLAEHVAADGDATRAERLRDKARRLLQRQCGRGRGDACWALLPTD